MAKEQKIELEGTVIDFAHDIYTVELDIGSSNENEENKTASNKPIVTARVSGRMRQNNIRIVAGDRVTVEFSPTCLTHGRITYRNK